MIIAGGIGQRAQGLFAEHGIEVSVGVGAGTPEKPAADSSIGTLEVDENVCDH